MTFKWILTQFWTALGSVWEALGSLSLPRNRRKLCSQPNYAFKWIWGWFWQALGKVFGGSVRRNDLEYKPVPIFNLVYVQSHQKRKQNDNKTTIIVTTKSKRTTKTITITNQN